LLDVRRSLFDDIDEHACRFSPDAFTKSQNQYKLKVRLCQFANSVTKNKPQKLT
jgi:hypothetical protein